MLRDERDKKGQEGRSIRKHLGMICSWSWSWQCFHQCIDMSKLITLYIVYELYPKDVWKNKQKVHHQFLEIKSRVYFFHSPKDSVISFYHLVNPFLLFKKKKYSTSKTLYCILSLMLSRTQKEMSIWIIWNN